jgi:hypothetical protein
MNRVLPLSVVVFASFLACGGKVPPGTEPAPAPSEAEDYCIRHEGTQVENGGDTFAEFCKTRGSDSELEKRMTDTIVAAGVDVRRFDLRCRAEICSIKCVTLPREQCVDDLRSVGRSSASQRIFDAIGFPDERGRQAFFKFVSKADLDSFPMRRELIGRIERRLHDSPTFKSCKQNASTHGVLLLYIDVPSSGTPSITVRGEVAQTADADCVSKALLAAVIEERVTPPLSSRGLAIAVKL